MNVKNLYEAALLVRIRLGDEAAFAELYRIYTPRIMAFAERLMNASPDQVEDVVQDTWLSVFKGLPRLSSDAKFKSWLFRIARDHIFNRYRIQRRTPEMEEVSEEVIAAAPDLSIDLETIWHGLAELAPEQSEALMLHYIEGFSYEEIAELTRARIGTVRSRIFYGKEALRQKLEKTYEQSAY